MEVKRFEFDAEMMKHPALDSCFIEFPYDISKEFGKGRLKVDSWIDGVLYHGSLIKTDGNCHRLEISLEVRNATGKSYGDQVHVVLVEDTEERIVEVPGELIRILKKEKALLDYFNRLPYTHRKEYVKWIVDAKREETKRIRVLKAVEMLRDKMKTPS